MYRWLLSALFSKVNVNKELCKSPWRTFSNIIINVWLRNMSMWIVDMTARIYAWNPCYWLSYLYRIAFNTAIQGTSSCFPSHQLCSLLVCASMNNQYYRMGVGSLPFSEEIELRQIVWVYLLVSCRTYKNFPMDVSLKTQQKMQYYN